MTDQLTVHESQMASRVAVDGSFVDHLSMEYVYSRQTDDQQQGWRQQTSDGECKKVDSSHNQGSLEYPEAQKVAIRHKVQSALIQDRLVELFFEVSFWKYEDCHDTWQVDDERHGHEWADHLPKVHGLNEDSSVHGYQQSFDWDEDSKKDHEECERCWQVIEDVLFVEDEPVGISQLLERVRS